MVRKPRSLRDTVVVITGGARGIGAAIAKELAAHDAKVAIGDLDSAAAAELAAWIGKGAIGLRLDVSDRSGFTGFLDTVERRLGPIDVVVNNAGIMPLGPFEEESDVAATRQLEINLHAVLHGTREAMRRMRPRGTGHIVNIASAAGKFGFPGGVTYCATKHGVVGLSEAVRLELRGSGVEVSCVMPAVVRTELAAGLGDVKTIKKVTAEYVAQRTVRVLQRPRFDVYIPRSVGVTDRITRLLPRAAAEWLSRTLGADRLLAQGAHSGARAGYESRAATSAPAADGASAATVRMAPEENLFQEPTGADREPERSE